MSESLPPSSQSDPSDPDEKRNGVPQENGHSPESIPADSPQVDPPGLRETIYPYLLGTTPPTRPAAQPQDPLPPKDDPEGPPSKRVEAILERTSPHDEREMNYQPYPHAPPRKKGPNKRAGETGPNVNPTVKLTEEKCQEYLGVLSRTGRKTASAYQVGISWAAICVRRRNDDAFATAVDEALEIYRDSIDAEIGRRGVAGITEDVWYQGEVVGKRTVFSDQLLLAHARAHHPSYKPSMDQNISVQGGIISMGLEELTQEDRTRLRKLLTEKKESPQEPS